MSAARSASESVGALVLQHVMVGMTEASTTRKRPTLRNRSASSTGALALVPIAQVPTGWWPIELGVGS